jgi:hypothetical protein
MGKDEMLADLCAWSPVMWHERSGLQNADHHFGDRTPWSRSRCHSTSERVRASQLRRTRASELAHKAAFPSIPNGVMVSASAAVENGTSRRR